MPRLLATGLLLAASIPAAFAQQGKAPWENYADRIAKSQEVGRLGDDLMGDSISLNDGGLRFSATDASLPGNAGPAVQVGRSYRVRDMRYRTTDGAFGDWDVSVPSISGKYLEGWVDSAGGQLRCKVGGPPPASASRGVVAPDYWSGLQLSLPGVGGGTLLASNGSQPERLIDPNSKNYPYLTNDHIRVECLDALKNPQDGVAGDGFLAITPDGTKYYFDWMARHSEPALRRGTKTVYTTDPLGNAIPREFTIPVHRHVLLATRVVDRFGNVVSYKYGNAPNGRTRLLQVRSGESDGTGGDGRVLTLSYNGSGFVSQVADNTGRVWTYGYGTTAEGRATLSSVKVPGNDTWSINLAQFTDAELEYPESPTWGERTCSIELSAQNAGSAAAPVGTLTHPSGATGTFTLGIRTHGRTNVPLNCANVTQAGQPNDPTDDVPYIPASYDSFSLVSKSLTGIGLPTMQWTYAYHSPRRYNKPAGPAGNAPVCQLGSLEQCAARPVCTTTSGCGLTATTLVTAPEGRWTRYTYGAEYRANEGQLLKTETGHGSGPSSTIVAGRPENVLREVRNTYLPANDDGSCAIQWGDSLEYGVDYSECVVPRTESAIWQQAVEFVWREKARNQFAVPTRVERFSRVGTAIRDQRTDVTTFQHDLPRWVIGMVTHEFNVETNRYTARTAYDPVLRLPVTNYWPYGAGSSAVARQQLVWSANGVLTAVKDGNLKSVSLTNWHRGVPRTVTYPDATTRKAVVNDRGEILRVTDQNNYATDYGYDARGLLASIVYPTGDSVAWNGTTLGFARTTAVEFGFPVGTWKRTVSTGTGVKITWFDAMWRPRMTREYDAASIASTQRFNAWHYNGAGETVFTAYPRSTATSMSSFVSGVLSEFDALGRVVMTQQDWEGPTPLETQTEFLDGFRTRTTNPRGLSTLTEYQAFSDPSAALPVRIAAPEGQRTTIVRDALGRALTLTRDASSGSGPSASRHYVYDDAGRLCKLTEPETGATVLNYDKAGNVVWSAAGLSLPSPNPAVTTHGVTCDAQRNTAYGSGRRVDRSYDALNRLITLDFPDDTGNQTWTYTPDGLPATISTTNNGLAEVVNNAYSYNRRRLLASETSEQPGAYAWTATYGYNVNGHLASLTYPGGALIDYAPNGLGQATRAGAYATGVSYFPNGAIRAFTYGNGIRHEMWQNARLLPERSKDGAILDLQHQYDANGNVVGTNDLVDFNRNRSMVYDGLDRLERAQSSIFGGNGVHVFAYDVLDNLRSWTRGAGSGDAGKDFATYEYDASNRLTRILGSSGQVRESFTWDVQGNLDRRNWGMAGARDFNFDFGNRNRGTPGVEGLRYDGYGRRVSTWMPLLGKARFYMYSRDGQLLFEGNETKGINSQHIYLGGSLVADIEYVHGQGITRIRYQHTDALGSPVAISNEAGAVVERIDYEPFGKTIGGTRDGVGYTGHVMDPQSGLVYMQQRYFDPTVGQFLSVDPIQADTTHPSNFNRYAYANSNPFKFVDPDGRQSICRTQANCVVIEMDLATKTNTDLRSMTGGQYHLTVNEDDGEEEEEEADAREKLDDARGIVGWLKRWFRVASSALGRAISRTAGPVTDAGQVALHPDGLRAASAIIFEKNMSQCEAAGQCDVLDKAEMRNAVGRGDMEGAAEVFRRRGWDMRADSSLLPQTRSE